MLELRSIWKRKEKVVAIPLGSDTSVTSFEEKICYCVECRVSLAENRSIWERQSTAGKRLFSKHAFSTISKVTVSSSDEIFSDPVHELYSEPYVVTETTLQYCHFDLEGSEGNHSAAILGPKQGTRDGDDAKSSFSSNKASQNSLHRQVNVDQGKHRKTITGKDSRKAIRSKCLASSTADCAALCCCPFTLFKLVALIWKLPTHGARKMTAKLRKKNNKLPFPEHQETDNPTPTLPRFSSSLDVFAIQESRVVMGFGDPNDWKMYFGSRTGVLLDD
ncbi:hypothetical protein O6H91_03G081100 [Diphasiastrum complanatum]|uniref:Uncharacterized protein n=2 Tax=Diphasiastrum complanatum TaxID=34168 RepID=A0ACC2E8A0_DIPCM|nr:hypothetical protein O6H91_03G081100 [Diphasiastrum complanatum]KAJ7562706.1 hypothetical protein O6H91_03G081100 [Diphasiastrum complanatum]